MYIYYYLIVNNFEIPFHVRNSFNFSAIWFLDLKFGLVARPVLVPKWTYYIILHLDYYYSMHIIFEFCSKMGLDLIPRVDGEVVDADSTSVVELYKVVGNTLKMTFNDSCLVWFKRLLPVF